jgi:16S rRNA processing protein RimM
MHDEQFFIAQIGRTVGLHGDLKLHLHTDFPEQFQVGTIVDSSRGELEIATYNPVRGLVSFVGHSSIDAAKKLTNTKLYSTMEKTRSQCELDEGQYFWFDIVGASIYQGEECVGTVEDIDRMLDTDYLVIKTDKALIEQGYAKDFLLPYIPRYILSVDTDTKRITTQDAKDILEAS